MTVPLTVFVAQQQQQTKQHASGFEETADLTQNTDGNLSQASNPQGCGDKCAEEPPPPSGIITINYCSQPLTVPKSEVSDTYTSYRNVKNNKDGKDNRYFVYVSKDNLDPVKIKVGNVGDVTVEQLAGEPVSFDGNNLTIVDSGAFAIHANPGKKSAVGPCILGAFCSYNDLTLKAESAKSRIYPSDNCAQLSSSMSYEIAKESADGDGGTGKGLLYAAYYSMLHATIKAEANVIGNAKLENPLPVGQEINIRIVARAGEDPVPLIVGEEYGRGSIAAVVYTEGGEVQRPLEFARNLKALPTPEAKIYAINQWIHENGVYPTRKVVDQMQSDMDPSGKPNQFKNPALAKYGSKFLGINDVATFLPAEETLTNIMSNKLADGRFFCICRDVALLATAMARQAGISAWPNGGYKQVLNYSAGKLEAKGGHEWVQYVDNGQIINWDPTIALSSDIFETNKNFDPSLPVKAANYSIQEYTPDVPVPYTRAGRMRIGMFNAVGERAELTAPFDASRVGLSESNLTGDITYELSLTLSDSGKIPVIVMANGGESLGSSFGYSVFTDSKAPIIIDTGKKLIPVNEYLFPKKTLNAINTYNDYLSNFFKNPPNNALELLREQQNRIRQLRSAIDDLNSKPINEDIASLEKALKKIKERLGILSSEKTVSVVHDTLAIAENPPPEVKGKLKSFKQLKQEKVFSKGVGGVTSGLGLILGSAIAVDLANTLDNGYLLMVAKATNTVGIAQLIWTGGKTVAQVSMATRTAFVAKQGASLAVGSAAGAVAGGAALGGAAASLGQGLVISSVATAMGTTFYCAANPKSSMCGCRISGEYGEGRLMLELQKYDVSKGDKVKYRILGFENCPTHVGLEAVFGIVNLANARAPEPKLTTGKDGNSPNPIGGQGAQCKWQPDGRWCLGEFPANLDKGSYKLTILQPQILVNSDSPLYLYPHDTGQVLNVDGGGNVLVKLVPSSTATPKLTLSPNRILTVTPIPDPQSIYNQCLKLCDQGDLIASESFDKPACVQNCNSGNSQYGKPGTLRINSPTPTLTSFPIVAPLTSAACFEKCIDEIADVNSCNLQCQIPTPTLVSAPRIQTSIPTSIPTVISQTQLSACQSSLGVADVNADGGVDMSDFNQQRDCAKTNQISEREFQDWIYGKWQPAFSSQ